SRVTLDVKIAVHVLETGEARHVGESVVGVDRQIAADGREVAEAADCRQAAGVDLQRAVEADHVLHPRQISGILHNRVTVEDTALDRGAAGSAAADSPTAGRAS